MRLTLLRAPADHRGVVHDHPSPAGVDSYPLDWPATLRRIGAELSPGEVIVPGHGTRVDRAFVENLSADLATIAAIIRDLHAADVPLEAATAAGADRWPWPTEALGQAVVRGYRQVEAAG